MSTEVVLFDLDDTLVIDQSSYRTAFLVTCEIAKKQFGCDPNQLTQAVWDNAHNLWHAAPTIKYCLDVDIHSWEGLWSHFLGDNPNLRFLREWVPDYRRQVWFQALSQFGIEDIKFADDLGETFIYERRKRHFLFSDVQDSLQYLRSKYRLGLVTNGPPDLQKEKIERTDIGKFFDHILISGEIGIGKPDARLFNLALRRFSIGPTAVVMIGDSLERDVQGAHNAGIRGVWINRAGINTENQDIVPDHEIKSLNELLDTQKPWTFNP